VARGEHRARDVQRAGGVVEQVGGAQPGVDHVDALAGRTLGEGPTELDAALAHVPRQHDPRAAGEAREGSAERAGDLAVQLAGAQARDVVRLDDVREVAGHGSTLWAAYVCFCALPSTEEMSSSRPSCFHALASQAWQEVKWTGEPSVSVIAIAVTRWLAHAPHVPRARVGVVTRDIEAP
jgi:hypothetical protein